MYCSNSIVIRLAYFINDGKSPFTIYFLMDQYFYIHPGLRQECQSLLENTCSKCTGGGSGIAGASGTVASSYLFFNLKQAVTVSVESSVTS